MFCQTWTSVFFAIVAALLRDAESFSTTPTKATKTMSSPYDFDAPGLSNGGADLEAYCKGHVAHTKDFEPTTLSLSENGVLPTDFPTGTYFKNGAGAYKSDDGVPYMHPFDCNGKIMAITLDPTKQQAVYRYKYVQTPKYQQDVATGTMSERGFFGTKRSGGFWGNVFQGMEPKNLANTAVILSDDQKSLYALWEAGRPYEMDPLTLETRGETFCGFLDSETSFSAHPSYDPKRKTFTNFCTSRPRPGKETSTVSFQELDANSLAPCSPGLKLELPGIITTHALVMTENYIIFSWAEAKVNIPKALQAALGFLPPYSLVENISSEMARYILIPRSLLSTGAVIEDVFNDERIQIVETPFHMTLHYTNAYEITRGGTTRIIFEVSCFLENISYGVEEMTEVPLWESFDWDGTHPQHLEQFEIDVDSGKLLRMETIAIESIDFLAVHRDQLTKPHGVVFTLGAHKPDYKVISNPSLSPLGTIRKINVQTKEQDVYSFAPYEFVHDGDVVRKVGADPADEDALYFVTVVTNGKDLTSDLVILDGQNMASGPVSRIRLPEIIPNTGLHGYFFEGPNQF